MTRIGAVRRRAPDGDIGRRRIKSVEKHRQLMLRMAGVTLDFRPVVGGAVIEARQHHMSVRQRRDTGDQLARGGKGAG